MTGFEVNPGLVAALADAEAPNLLPCPFCGEDAEIDYGNLGPLFTAYCFELSCDATQQGESEQQVATMWNRRHYPPEIEAERVKTIMREQAIAEMGGLPPGARIKEHDDGK